MPVVSVVIVNWNVRDLLRKCLESLPGALALPEATVTFETIVVDNGSRDGSVEMLRETFRNVQLIQPGENTGFSRGNNIGIEASSGQYVLILNPDTEALPGSIARLVQYMEAHPTVGVAGPQLLNEDGSVQSSRRRFPSLMTAFFESTWLQPLAPRGMLRWYYMLDIDDSAETAVDWLQGAALLVRREAINDAGMFDERFFMYSEELDWQRRMKAAGWNIIYLPSAKIIHYGGRSSDQVVAQKHIHFQTSKIRYFTKHHGRLAGVSLRLFLLANYAAQLVLEAAKSLVGHKRALRQERIAAYLQVLRSGLKG